MNVLPFVQNRELGYGAKYRCRKKSDKLNEDFALQKLAAKRGDMRTFQNMGMKVPPFSCQFCKVSGAEHILAVSNEDGYIFLLDSMQKPGKRCRTYWTAHSNAVFDIHWLPGKYQLLTASGDNTTVLWDACSKKRISSFVGHTGTVRCIDVSPVQSAVFATGSRDSTIRLWDSRCNKREHFYTAESVISMASDSLSKVKQRRTACSQKKSLGNTNSKTSHCHQTSVTSLAFQGEHDLFAAGVTDGLIKVWDLRKTYSTYMRQPLPKYELPICGPKIHGFVSMVFDSCRKYLYASCTDHTIYCYDCHTYNPQYVKCYNGFRASSYFVKMAISSDDEYLLSGSTDEKAYIWKASKPGPPILQLPGHTDEVTSVAWNPKYNTQLVTCGDDVNVFFWEIYKKENEEVVNDDFIFTFAEPFVSSDMNKSVIEDVSQPESEFVTERSLKRIESSEQNAVPPIVITAKKQKLMNSSHSITQWFFSPKIFDVTELKVNICENKHAGTDKKKELEKTGSTSDSPASNQQVLSPNKIRPEESNTLPVNSTRRVLKVDPAGDSVCTKDIDELNLASKETSVLDTSGKENVSLVQIALPKIARILPSKEVGGCTEIESPLPEGTFLSNTRKNSLKRKSRKSTKMGQNECERTIASYFSSAASKPKI